MSKPDLAVYVSPDLGGPPHSCWTVMSGRYQWEEIPGKGKCLVPVPQKPKVTAEDVMKFKTYLNLQGKVMQIMGAFSPQEGGCRQVFFYTIRPQFKQSGFSGVSFTSASALAEFINGVSEANECAFREWV